MHDKDTKSLTLRVTTNNTFTISNSTEMVTQIVSNCSNAGNGSNWTLVLKDKLANAHVWVGPLTMTGPSGGPTIFRFDSPLRFSDGVVATTTGNAGVLDLAVSVLNTQGQ